MNFSETFLERWMANVLRTVLVVHVLSLLVLNGLVLWSFFSSLPIAVVLVIAASVVVANGLLLWSGIPEVRTSLALYSYRSGRDE